MEVKHAALSGTLESSDVQVTIEPASGLSIDIQSNVIHQYGRRIREVVAETLENLGIRDAAVLLVDHGALDCTLRARVESAAFRACDVSEGYPWGGAIQA